MANDDAHPDKPAKNAATTTAPQPTRASQDTPRKAPAPKPPAQLPPWKVILHNDHVNDQLHVVETILMLTSLNKPTAIRRMFEAHHAGRSLLLTTHRERAELYQQQFASRNLTVTIEKA